MKEKILDSELMISKNIIYKDNLSNIERLSSMLLDHFITCFIIIPIIIIPFAIGLETSNRLLNEILLSLTFGLYLNKDFLNGRSLAKRILGQIVLDLKTNQPANELKCAIRNFTLIFWIFEIITVLISPNRRIGDFIIGTKVVRAEEVNLKGIITDLNKMNKINFMLSMGLTIFYINIFFLIVDTLLTY